MNNIEKEELNEYLRRIEMYMPKGWTLQYGEWDKFKILIEDLVNEINDEEDRADDAEAKSNEWEGKYESVMEEIQELKDWVSRITWIDNPEHEELVADITKQLKEIG